VAENSGTIGFVTTIKVRTLKRWQFTLRASKPARFISPGGNLARRAWIGALTVSSMKRKRLGDEIVAASHHVRGDDKGITEPKLLVLTPLTRFVPNGC
jgi:exoribonuclease II